jgi:hypothetical protein
MATATATMAATAAATAAATLTVIVLALAPWSSQEHIGLFLLVTMLP